MHFNSVEQILIQLEQQPGWEKFRDYRQLLQCWDKTVNQNIAQHTRPLYITRQVLYVTTSSAARAQELSFQRYTLLKRLNKQLTFELKDLRFSSVGWHQKIHESVIRPNLFTIGDRQKSKTIPNASMLVEQNSLNRIDDTSSTDKAKAAARHWLKTIADRSSLSCPKCNSLISKEEMARWNCCYHCVAQKWSDEYRPPTFPETK